MSTAGNTGRSKRLARLLCSDLRPTEDLEDYVVALKTLTSQLADEDLIDTKTRLLKSLANETRLKMLRLLNEREMCVCELTVALNLTQPTASHHLNILENMRLIRDRKEGKWVFYSVSRPKLIQSLFDFLEFPE
ncbi:MAG: metalloregulator ArsR/SmtB family transcription factor [Candidatus Bathyarchaeota archaeon]|nr:metalloregulator ArsR/SmtB family transcription factor [Candidatus Bathyarchaeota archaeon]